jgi:hypothetical protein
VNLVDYGEMSQAEFKRAIISVVTLLVVLGGCLGFCLYQEGCAAAPAAEQKGMDALQIEASVAACIATNILQPDTVIIQRCSPASANPAQAPAQIQVVLNICRHGYSIADAGPLE